MVSGYMLYVFVVILLGGLGEANFRKSLVQLPLPHPEKFGTVKKDGEGEKRSYHQVRLGDLVCKLLGRS